jgi:hypothetical protein
MVLSIIIPPLDPDIINDRRINQRNCKNRACVHPISEQ